MANDEGSSGEGLSRRKFVATALLGVGGSVLAPRAMAATSPTPSSGALTAQTTEGPYYLKLDLMRADIREGLDGIPLDIAFTVLDESNQAYAGALVDVWHCDAQGNYSGFEQPDSKAELKSKTFLRGTQAVGADGAVTFQSIYPGWYRGRTTHIHLKVRRGDLTNLTTQFFLPDTLSEFLYDDVPVYQRKELRDTLNSTDGIAINAGHSVEGSVREAQGKYVVSLMVRVNRNANPPIDRPPAPGKGLGMGMPPPFGHHGPPPHGGLHGMPPPPFQHDDALQGTKRIEALLPDAPRIKRNKPFF